jgi:hypothetical protein
MRAFQDLREVPGVLEQEKQLLRIDDPVTLEPDLGTVGCTLTSSGKPAWPLCSIIVQPIAPPNMLGKRRHMVIYFAEISTFATIRAHERAVVLRLASFC